MPTAALMALTTAVHQAEGSHPETSLTSSWWPPGEEGSPVLHSWWPLSPPSFFPHNTWLHRLPRKLDSNSSSACPGARFPLCWEITLNTGSCGTLKAMLDIPNSLDPPLGPSSCSPDPTSVPLLSCPAAADPGRGSLTPGETSTSSTGGVAELRASKASCKPECCPAEAGSD